MRLTIAIAVLLLLCTQLGAAPLKHQDSSTPSTTAAEYWIGPGISGTWYDPARSGEGVVLQMLPDGSVIAVWFTYPAVGEPGEQAWLLGRATAADRDTLRMETVVQPMGARFGAAFDPQQVQQLPWGRFEFEFDDCNHATLRYQGPAAYGSGERQLLRLTEVDELECIGQRDLLPNGARALDGLRAKSGTWHVPTRTGEGWLIEDFPDGRSGVYWFTFDESGRQRWIAGVGARDGARLVLQQPFLSRGTRFGAAFRSEAVQLETFGAIALEFSSCEAVQLNYAALRPELGSAQRNATKLTGVAGARCLNGTPQTSGGLRWIERSTMPGSRNSEHAAVSAGEHIYTVGGFGTPRAFQRYSPANGQWLTLPDLPDGRHHLSAFVHGDDIYAVGGFQVADTGGYVGAYRYAVSQGSGWMPVPEVQHSVASNSTLLFGRAFIGSDDGTLQEYEPVARRARNLGHSGEPVGRDHSQVIAFLDEIWMLGGRLPENAAVSIYNPASGRWRRGPRMSFLRGGFAAAAVGNRIVVAGGELLSTTPFQVIDSVEVYTAGDSVWTLGPNLPIGLHGVPGVSWRNRFFIIGGSTIGGSAGAGSNKVYELELP